jgi:hypothetical protein
VSYPPEAWERLGRLLVSRRVQLDPAFRNRQKFIAATGMHERLVSDLEKGRRYSYRPATIDAVEAAYGLTPGSLDRVLQGGAPGLIQTGSATMSAAATLRAAAEVIPAPPVDLPDGVDWNGLTPLERYLWLAPGAEVYLRQAWIDMLQSIRDMHQAARPGDSGEHRRSV